MRPNIINQCEILLTNKLSLYLTLDLDLKLEAIFVGSSGLRIIKKGGVEFIIDEPLLIKIYPS